MAKGSMGAISPRKQMAMGGDGARSALNLKKGGKVAKPSKKGGDKKGKC